MARVCLLTLLGWCVLGVAGNWPRPSEGPALSPLRIRTQDAEFEGTVNIQRIPLRCSAGPCVVFRKDGRLKRPNTDAFRNLGDWLQGFGGEVVDDATWGLNENGRPFRAGDIGDHRFNCHSYAIGASVGLTPADWVQGIALPETENANPMENFIQSYYEHKRTFRIATDRPSDFESASEFQNDDIALLTLNQNGSPLHHVHAGKLHKRNDKWWIKSKLGEAFPVVLTPLGAVASVYNRQFNEVRVYRLKPAP